MNKILFLCTGNSCRSQIAEAIARKEIDHIVFESAGTNPEKINPYAIATLKNIGIDISSSVSKKINFKNINKYDLVITLCGSAKDNCPIVNYPDKHTHWDIEDPAKFEGNKKEIHSKFAEIRDIIYKNIKNLQERL